MQENDLRDFLFNNYKNEIHKIICNEPPKFTYNQVNSNQLPILEKYIKEVVEDKINKYVNELDNLKLLAKEISLKKIEDTTTRIDLIGNIPELRPFAIIELKISKQTERQVFTEILAYRNHLMNLFTGLSSEGILSIMITLMETRIGRDSFFCDLFFNENPILALIPQYDDHGHFNKLQVYYPPDYYYRDIGNTLFKKNKIRYLILSFGEEHLIQEPNDEQIDMQSLRVLERLSSEIAIKLDSIGVHGFVCARQRWKELYSQLFYPNSIIIMYYDPFCTNWTFEENTKEEEISHILDKIDPNFYNLYTIKDKELDNIIEKKISDNPSQDPLSFLNDWLDDASMSHDAIITSQVIKVFKENIGDRVHFEINTSNQFFMENSIEVTYNYSSAYCTGFVKSLFQSYINFQQKDKNCSILCDDIPRYNIELKLYESWFIQEFIRLLDEQNEYVL